MSKKVVYVFSDIPYDEFADYVRCANCDIEMLVPCGTEKCPICEEDGMTMWVDDDEQEVNIDEFMKEHDVVEVDAKYFDITEKVLNEGIEDKYGDLYINIELEQDGTKYEKVIVSRHKIRPEVEFEVNGVKFREDIRWIEDYDAMLADEIYGVLF